MKKVFTASALFIAAAISFYLANDSTADENGLQFSDVEALSDCEMYNSDGTLFKKCVGKENVCHKISMGSGFFYCYGEQVYPKLEEES